MLSKLAGLRSLLRRSVSKFMRSLLASRVQKATCLAGADVIDADQLTSQQGKHWKPQMLEFVDVVVVVAAVALKRQ